jgi:HAD superfamily hydrolase (TIGR01458 family)
MTIQAILFDIDGTLTERGQAIPGAAETVAHARMRGIEVRFLTNITGHTPEKIAANLGALGIAVEAAEVQTATTVCVAMLAAKPGVRCHLMVPASVMPMFDGIVRDDVSPDVVVVSDVGEGFTFAAMNRAFQMLRNGADLMALQKNMFWFDADGIKLDCGPFVLALEAASGKTATVTGKPSPVFFETALASLACARQQVLIVGDDLGTDIAGGNQVKVRTALMGTGKYAAGQRTSAHWKADHFLDSIADLPPLLSQALV